MKKNNTKKPKVHKVLLTLGALVTALGLIALAMYGIEQVELATTAAEPAVIEEIPNPDEKAHQQAIKAIMGEDTFKSLALQEAEIIYYQRQMDKAREALQQLEGAGFSSQNRKAEVLGQFLESKGAMELAKHAGAIVELDRWIDVVAIIGHETNFCQLGVGKSRNNCGAIKDHKTGDFRYYENEFEATKSVANLLQTPRYKDKSLAQMNGIYCVNEEVGHGNCPNWTETITRTANELTALAYAYLY